MKTIKEIFDVEIGEKFGIKIKEGHTYYDCYFDKDKELAIIEDNKTRNWFLELCLLKELIAGEAEIIKIKPEILDKKEKEFLSFIVNHLGRDKIESIVKVSSGKDKEFIKIKVRGVDFAAFPDFPKGTMYKGMESYHYYTLEELKI